MLTERSQSSALGVRQGGAGQRHSPPHSPREPHHAGYAHGARKPRSSRSPSRQALGGTDLIPGEMISAYAILKKAAAIANFQSGRLNEQQHTLIVQVCEEIQAG